MKNPSILLLATMLFFACKKDEFEPPFNNTAFYENHLAAHWTKETAAEHLQGSWKLIYLFCCGFGESHNWAAIDNGYFELQFVGDRVSIFTNNTLGATLCWEFDERHENTLNLASEEFIPNTAGALYFSDHYMLFNGSPTDGLDNYFQKVN